MLCTVHNSCFVCMYIHVYKLKVLMCVLRWCRGTRYPVSSFLIMRRFLMLRTI